MRHYLFVFFYCFLATLSSCKKSEDLEQKETKTSMAENKPYVILVSIDGFRPDYAQLPEAKNLKKFQTKGVSAQYMLPCFPSSTFANHYSLVTGLYPAHHGIADQRFYSQNLDAVFNAKKGSAKEGKWFKGVPLWILAEKNNVRSYSSYWFGSEAEIDQTRPSVYLDYLKEEESLDTRIDKIIQELKKPSDQRPHFFTFYLSEVDKAGHKNGPYAKETKEAIQKDAQAIQSLYNKVSELNLPNVNYIFVSDHGMVEADINNTIPYPDVDDKKFVMTTDETMIQLYAKKGTNEADISTLYNKILSTKSKGSDKNQYDIYLKKDVPAHLNYGITNDKHGRIGDILLMAKSPYQFFKEETQSDGSKTKPKKGCHGYDPTNNIDLRATFFAWGPAFQEKKIINGFNNIDIYPLVAHLLRLNYTHVIDGNKNTLVNANVLKNVN